MVFLGAFKQFFLILLALAHLKNLLRNRYIIATTTIPLMVIDQLIGIALMDQNKWPLIMDSGINVIRMEMVK